MPLKNYIIEMREAKRATWKKVTTTEPNITSYCLQKLVIATQWWQSLSEYLGL
jgi:hypothetical protein